jgi:hypothetical protein
VECKIAEQNMISVAAGMSASGKVPFASTFSKFVTRAYDQIEMAMNGGANLKVVGSHSGITLAADGPSQMSLPDVAWFRSLSTTRDHNGNPGCYILQPADAYAAYALTGVMAEYEGLCYMRTLRADTEFVYGDDQVFNLGGFETLTEGRDVVICACGYMVQEANKAVELLDKAGVSATLLDMYSIPFDTDKLLDIIAANGGYAVSIEDNYGGGWAPRSPTPSSRRATPSSSSRCTSTASPRAPRRPRRCWRCAASPPRTSATAPCRCCRSSDRTGSPRDTQRPGLPARPGLFRARIPVRCGTRVNASMNATMSARS